MRTYYKTFSVLIYLAGILNLSSAHSNPIEIKYRIQWGEVYIGDASAKFELSTDSYKLYGLANSSSGVRLLYRYSGSVNAGGRLIGGVFTPDFLRISGTRNDKQQSAETLWSVTNSAPITFLNPKLNLEKVYPISQNTLKNTFDPISGIMNSLKTIKLNDRCSGTYRIFDGRRRSDITLHDLGKEELVADRNWSFGGPVWVCGVTANPLGGHKRRSPSEEEKIKEKNPYRVRAYVGNISPNLIGPVKLVIESFFGNIIARLDIKSLNLPEQ